MPFPVDNIRAVCRERGTTLAQVEKALGFGNGVIARWEKMKGSPEHNRVVAVADFLRVPVYRLTGEEENPMPNSTGLPSEFVDIFNRLSAQGKADLDKYARFLLSQEADK